VLVLVLGGGAQVSLGVGVAEGGGGALCGIVMCCSNCWASIKSHGKGCLSIASGFKIQTVTTGTPPVTLYP